MNFSFICSNILAAPRDGVYVSQLKRCSASSGSPSWMLISFIDSVSQMHTDMFGLYWLHVISFVFAHDLSPCVTYDRLLASAASWLPLVEQDLIYHLESLCLTPVLMGLLLLIVCLLFFLFLTFVLRYVGFLCLLVLKLSLYLVRILYFAVICTIIRTQVVKNVKIMHKWLNMLTLYTNR